MPSAQEVAAAKQRVDREVEDEISTREAVMDTYHDVRDMKQELDDLEKKAGGEQNPGNEKS